MGVTRWLVRVDPETWMRACAVVEQRSSELLSVGAASSVLRQFGREPTEERLAFLQGADEAPEMESSFLASLLEELVREEEWYLDKSLNQLEAVARALPEGEALLDIIDFRGLDVELPAFCRDMDSGLFGCCTASRLRACSAFLRGNSAEKAEATLQETPHDLIARLSGRATRAAKAAEILKDDYHRSYWEVLRTAVCETVDRGHYLGLGMSP